MLPFSVWFADRKQGRIAVLPVGIPQPQRNFGIRRRADPPANPAAAFGDYVIKSFETMQALIARHQNAVVWRRLSGLRRSAWPRSRLLPAGQGLQPW